MRTGMTRSMDGRGRGDSDGRHLICPSFTQTLTRPLNQVGRGQGEGVLILAGRGTHPARHGSGTRPTTVPQPEGSGSCSPHPHCMKPPSVSRALFPPLSRFKLHAHCSGPDNCPTRSRQEPRTTELAQTQRRRDIILGPGDLPEDRTAENLVMHTRMSARGGGVSMVEEDKEPTRASVQAGALGRRLSPSRHN